MRLHRLILICAGLFGFAGCAAPDNRQPLADQLFTDAVEANAEAREVPGFVQDALTKSARQTARAIDETDRFDIAVKDMPARAFFMGLMSDADVNVVTHPEVSGIISLELSNVSVREVLDVVRDVYG